MIENIRKILPLVAVTIGILMPGTIPAQSPVTFSELFVRPRITQALHTTPGIIEPLMTGFQRFANNLILLNSLGLLSEFGEDATIDMATASHMSKLLNLGLEPVGNDPTVLHKRKIENFLMASVTKTMAKARDLIVDEILGGDTKKFLTDPQKPIVNDLLFPLYVRLLCIVGDLAFYQGKFGLVETGNLKLNYLHSTQVLLDQLVQATKNPEERRQVYPLMGPLVVRMKATVRSGENGDETREYRVIMETLKRLKYLIIYLSNLEGANLDYTGKSPGDQRLVADLRFRYGHSIETFHTLLNNIGLDPATMPIDISSPNSQIAAIEVMRSSWPVAESTETLKGKLEEVGRF